MTNAKIQRNCSIIAIIAIVVCFVLLIVFQQCERIKSLIWITPLSLIVVLIILFFITKRHKKTSNWRHITIKLLSSAITTNWLAVTYLICFVFGMGWITECFSNLFNSTKDFFQSLYITISALLSLIAIIVFFPKNTKPKIDKPKKVFISGISTININDKPFHENNLIPIISPLQITNEYDAEHGCDMIILLSDAFAQAKHDRIKDSLISLMKKTNDKKVINIEQCSDVNECLKIIIKEVAAKWFPEKQWIHSKLNIVFTPPVNYNSDFNNAFSTIKAFADKYDDEGHKLIFNTTPGTAMISSIMTLLSIDDDREIYFHSQDHEIAKDKKLIPIDKTQIPIQNLLSQAIESMQ